MSLEAYGWSAHWSDEWARRAPDGTVPGRVVAAHRERYRVHTGAAELGARVAGRLRHDARTAADLPAVGDWVALEGADAGSEAVIRVVLPRVSRFSRKAAGTRTDEQVVAANVDSVWIVSAFGVDLNPARIDRYVALVWQGGASPRVILTKADLAEDPEEVAREMADRLLGVPVHAVSSVAGTGLDELRARLAPGKTIAMLGSSGVGKSTLLNALAGREIMAVGEVSERTGKGRHRTTHRQLIRLPDGGLLLDTPGMRELQLWEADEGVDRGFADIDELAAGCRFADCRHESEPGCAVLAAVDDATLAPERLESWRKLVREAAYLDRKIDVRAGIEERKKWKMRTMEYRRHFKKDDG